MPSARLRGLAKARSPTIQAMILLLAKHSQPVVDSTAPSNTWRLSTAGRRRAIALAASVRRLRPTKVLSSPERKALETAQIVAASLRLAVEASDGLREQERPSLPFSGTPDDFERSIEAAFARPGEAIYGGESVDTARLRFAEVVERLRAAFPGETPLIVSHGTVLAAFAAHVTGQPAFALWRGLDLPCWLALDLDASAIVESWRAARSR